MANLNSSTINGDLTVEGDVMLSGGGLQKQINEITKNDTNGWISLSDTVPAFYKVKNGMCTITFRSAGHITCKQGSYVSILTLPDEIRSDCPMEIMFTPNDLGGNQHGIVGKIYETDLSIYCASTDLKYFSFSVTYPIAN